MSGENVFSSTTLSPIVNALQEAITVTDIVNLFTSGVVIALPLILVWFGARWVYKINFLYTLNSLNACKSGVT